ncbi:DUF2752 domain-containing protein [Myroides sp. M-43]|uniref:DUF2752 domain-containing protein n=1 Tax=Myroides oncorhynchi TaxID=2893756 RepID=UPI001E4E0CEF|nr:DUF2752 domain-containing protein [Myroides oncorhynchi]MCC9043453.1 DUF2752 domain-containing protein [Myroides oncorhynchi]
MLKLIISYIKSYKIIVAIGMYIILSVLLRATTGIDVCIPCLWKTLFGVECPGCGLTTAFERLIQLDINGAKKSNWLIFIIIPCALSYIVKDFLSFKKRQYL